MISKTTAHYVLTFYENFVIAEALEGVVVDNKIVSENLKIVFDHYQGKPFTIISHRKNDYTLNLDLYTGKLIKKVRALAVVSSKNEIKENALAEQLAFNQSFAFFENLDDAKSWAQSVMVL